MIASISRKSALVALWIAMSVAACGGTSARSDRGKTAGEAGAGASIAAPSMAEAGSNSEAPQGGQPSVPSSPPETPADAGADVRGENGGAPGGTSRPPAGRALCAQFDDCSGLDCQRFQGAPDGACSVACDEQRPCRLGEVCFGGGELRSSLLEPLCLQPCQSTEDCAYGFDCVRYLDQATLCLPSAWAEIIMTGAN